MAEILEKLVLADPQHEAIDGTMEGFRGYTRCLPGAKEKGIIYGTGAWEKGDILGLPVMQESYEMGKRI